MPPLFCRLLRARIVSAAAIILSLPAALGGQGAVRMLYTVPNTTFIQNPSGDSVVTINDTSGSIAILQATINSTRTPNPNSILVIRLLTNATYSVSSAGLVLGSGECLVASGATIQAASAAVTVPLIQIAAGSTNVSVAGGTLDGNGANINGIQVPAANRVNIDRVTVRNCGQDCILLKGNGNSTYDNELTVTRCDVSGSPQHAGISLQNSTQTVCVDNNCHNNSQGIYLNCAWATVANNTCQNNTTGIDVAGGNDNVVANNTCNHNGTGIHAGGSNNMIVSDALGGSSAAGINSDGSGSHFIDNLFTAGNANNFLSGGSGNNVVAYKASLSASGQNYFYPPLISDQHTNPIVNGMGRTDLTIGSTTIDSVQSQYNAALAANPGNAVVLHLPGTYSVGATPLTLSANTCVLLSGTIQINGSTGASSAVKITNGATRVSLSGGIIDGGNLTGNNGIQASTVSMLQIDAVTLRNFGPDNPRSGGSDVIHFDHGSAPYIVTRCTINGGSARGIWLQLSGVKSLISDNDVSNVNQDGVDCDSATSGAVVKFNYCHDLVRYGVFFEQSASHDLALGNICNNDGRDINLYNNSTTPRGSTEYNTVACNWCKSNNGIRNGSTGTNIVTTSHNFMFNNVVINASISSEQVGVENYYSQNYLSGGSLSTSGTESFFNSTDVDGNVSIQDGNGGLNVLVQNDATTNGAPVVIGPAIVLGNDQWKFVPTDSGYYQVVNKRSGLVLNVSGASTNVGAPIIQWPYSADTTYNDEWLIQPAGNGLFNFIGRQSGLYLDVPGASLTAGTQLDQQSPNGGANQQFNINGAPLPSPPPFTLSASPSTQTILAGGATNYTVTISTNSNFSGAVSFGLSGMPSGGSFNFSPPILTGAGSSLLTITTTTNTPLGGYALNISATNGTNIMTAMVSLNVNSPFVANPGTLVWTDGSGIDTNWSRPLNWTNITGSGNGPPGVANDLKFFDLGTVGAVSNANNFLDADVTVNSLQYGNTNGFHTTLINPGRTLTTGSLTLGTETDNGNTQSVFATISGTGGRLAMTNTNSTLIVRQGVATASGNSLLRATLDLSGLDNFTAAIGKVQIGSQGANARPSGTLYLAKTNLVNATGSSPALQVGGQGGGSGNAGNGSFVYLGQANSIFANGISVGLVKQGGSSMLFNPAFANPTAYFRAADGVSPIGNWFIADSGSQGGTVNTTATNDFTGGTVDALINNLTLARSSTGSGNGNPVGVLTFSAGTINVSTLEVGYQGASGSNFSTAIVNVNNAGQLEVTGTLELAHTAGGYGAPFTVGTLNVNVGTVVAATIVNGGGLAVINASGGGALILSSVGTSTRSLSAINLTNAALRFQLDAGAIFTNIFVTNLTAAGFTSINVDSLAHASGTNRFPLIKYATLTGSIAANFAVGDLPDGFAASLSNNAAGQTIDLIVRPAPISRPVFATASFSAVNGTLTLSGDNGTPGNTYYVLASTNMALPLSAWVSQGNDVFDGNGHFSFILNVDPNLPRQFYILQVQP